MSCENINKLPVYLISSETAVLFLLGIYCIGARLYKILITLM